VTADVHAFTTQLVDADAHHLDVLKDALADAGCLDIDSTSRVTLIAGAHGDTPDLSIVCVQPGDVGPLHHLATLHHAVPVLAVCDEVDIDAAFAAGAIQCITRPVRRRELVGRIRETMRNRNAGERNANREQQLSEAIAMLQREKQDLERLVCVDSLTGIANRRHAMELLEAEWKRCARDQRPLALIMIDLDCFHAYNEHYGHPGGDSCLQRVADAMVRALRRPSDVLGRYGGEEFMAVLPNTDAVGAKIVAERLRSVVEALALPHAGSTCAPVVTITAGVAAIRVLPADTTDKLIAAADASLLEAKRNGRNRVGGFAPLVRSSRVSAQRWERYASVYVDPWFADRVPAYLDQVQQTVRATFEVMHAGARGSGVALKRLDESALRYGLPMVSVLLRELATALREADLGQVHVAAEELVQYVTHVQIIYRRTSDLGTSPTMAQTG
jgi:diguanylate cyclase (GGDEF)-like protein